jgi:dipeptidyl aminopeptidase/acylaminoacyl peptidase
MTGNTPSTDTLLEIGSWSDPRLSPTERGARPAWGVAVLTDVVTHASNSVGPHYRSRLVLLDLRPGSRGPRWRTITQGDLDREPRWSPDGAHIAFTRSVRDASGKPGPTQLMLLDLAGGEPRPLASHPNPIRHHAWLDARTLVYVSRRDRHDDAVARGLGRRIERRSHRFDGMGWVPEPETDLVKVDLEGNARVLRTLPQTPSELAVTADGSTLAWMAPRDNDEWDDLLQRIHICPVNGRGRPRDLLGVGVRAGQLAFVPDGSAITFVAPSDLRGQGRESTLFKVDLKAGARQPTPLTHGVEVGCGVAGDTRYGAFPTTPRFHPDGRTLTVVVNRRGRSALAKVHSAGKHPRLEEPRLRNRVISAFDAAGGWALAVVENATSPSELLLQAPDGRETALTALHAPLNARMGWVAPQERTLKGVDGHPLHYFWWAPKRPRKDRAMVVQVHGGPHTNDGFGFRFEYQRLLAAGYAVVSLNPRGSTSLGEAHAMAVLQAYGTIDALDVMAVVEHASAAAGGGVPVHLTGGSYGGFMTNWLVGAHPARFRSAVTQRSICNWVSFYGTSDIGPRFTEAEVGVAPWENLEGLWRASPLSMVAQVRTPILILHSENDHRCPIEQAEQWFSALKRVGKAETALVRFPDEGHELSRSGRPDRRMQRLDLILGWFENHP